MKTYMFPKCLNPLRITNKYTHEKLFVGCGKCALCKANKGFRYSSLCEMEAAKSFQVVFSTLTYAPEYLPTFRIESVGHDHYDCFTHHGEYLGTVEYGNLSKITKLIDKCGTSSYLPTVSKTDVQKFLKRLRKNYGKKVRYFICAEYGPKSFKPHYHVLFFFDTSDCLTRDGNHTIGEFPAYTRSKNGDNAPAETPITDFEYYLRKAWPFGRVDCTYITQGSCSQYVAFYVNSPSSLPAFFALPSTSCFCLHSRFLGRQILREEFATYIFEEPARVANRVISLPDGFREQLLSRENIAALYPQCKGFASKSREARLVSYTILNMAHCYYLGNKMDIARAIAHDLYKGFHNECVDYFSDSVDYTTRYEDYISLPHATYELEKIYYEDFMDKLTYSIYTELLCSGIFLQNVTALKYLVPTGRFEQFELKNYSVEQLIYFYYDRIVEMYDYLDQRHLKDLYEHQQEYFSHYDYEDLPYFYNNGTFDLQSFKQTLSVKVWTTNRMNFLKDKQKHKIQNDLNQIFL